MRVQLTEYALPIIGHTEDRLNYDIRLSENKDKETIFSEIMSDLKEEINRSDPIKTHTSSHLDLGNGGKRKRAIQLTN